MKVGVVYKFSAYNKVNGSLFYCYEYCQYLRNFCDCVLYIVNASPNDALTISALFDAKYTVPTNNIKYLSRVTDIYRERLDKTLVLDINTFNATRAFLTNEILCYSNSTHEMFQYKDGRHVTYFGSYDYQRFDVFSYLKLNFDLFKPCKHGDGVFISGTDVTYMTAREHEYIALFSPKPIILKSKVGGIGDIFDHIDSVHYVHTKQDKNNRIIPEAFFHNKMVTMSSPLNIPIDSAQLRYDDITANGLSGYTISEQDNMVQACLR